MNCIYCRYSLTETLQFPSILGTKNLACLSCKTIFMHCNNLNIDNNVTYMYHFSEKDICYVVCRNLYGPNSFVLSSVILDNLKPCPYNNNLFEDIVSLKIKIWHSKIKGLNKFTGIITPSNLQNKIKTCLLFS